MAHWAEIDENNIVLRILVLADDKNKNWLEERFGGNWIETSYTGSIRKNFAGVGHTYDAELDAFIPEKPFNSWVLDTETFKWIAPVTRPSDGKFYFWDEDTTSWVEEEEE